jgi:hypothetical protein
MQYLASWLLRWRTDERERESGGIWRSEEEEEGRRECLDAGDGAVWRNRGGFACGAVELWLVRAAPGRRGRIAAV